MLMGRHGLENKRLLHFGHPEIQRIFVGRGLGWVLEMNRWGVGFFMGSSGSVADFL